MMSMKRSCIGYSLQLHRCHFFLAKNISRLLTEPMSKQLSALYAVAFREGIAYTIEIIWA